MQPHKSTQCVHAGASTSDTAEGITTPIFTATSYAFPGRNGEVHYPRYFNVPTQEKVADKIRQLEKGQRGIVLSSGMAAVTSTLLGLLKQGDHAVFHAGIYGGSRSFVERYLTNYGIDYSLVSGCDVEDFAHQMRENTRLVFFESPTNPLLSIVPIRQLANLAQERGILTVVDNTFATPVSQNPLELGVDVVLHSGTKYLNGHSDVNCGAVVCSQQLAHHIIECASHLGGTLDVRACYLLERGMKTLALRVERQSQNAQQLAEYFQRHARVRHVYYPGLPGHPGHEVAAQQMSMFGGMLSILLDTDEQTAKASMSRLRVATMAVSLGGVETLVCFPKDTSHAALSADQRRREGIGDTLVRVSVGIEHIDDLLADFDEALN